MNREATPVKSIIKRVLLVLLLASYSCILIADDIENLNIYVKGNPMSLKLSDNPVLTYSDNKLKIAYLGNATNISVSDIDYIIFDNKTTATFPIRKNYVHYLNGIIFISHLSPNSRVSLYSISGTKLADTIIGNNGDAAINVGSMAKGIYILRTSLGTIKFINK